MGRERIMEKTTRNRLETEYTLAKLKDLLKEHYSIGLHTVLYPELLDKYIPESTRILNELATLSNNIPEAEKASTLFKTFNLDLKPIKEN